MKITVLAVAVMAFSSQAFADDNHDDDGHIYNGEVHIEENSISKSELTQGLRSEINGKANVLDVNAKNASQDAAIQTNAEAIAEAEHQMNVLADELEQGLATSSALHIPHVERNFAASLTGGFQNDKSAVGIGAGARFNETWQVGGSVAIGTDGGDVAGKAALTGQW